VVVMERQLQFSYLNSCDCQITTDEWNIAIFASQNVVKVYIMLSGVNRLVVVEHVRCMHPELADGTTETEGNNADEDSYFNLAAPRWLPA